MSKKYSIFAKLIRAGLAGVNAHTLTVGLHRLDQAGVVIDTQSDQQAAITLLNATSYPESEEELHLFLEIGQSLTPGALLTDGITDQHATAYLRWLTPLLNHTEVQFQKNAGVLLHWLAANWQSALHDDQACLDGLRELANQEALNRKQAGLIAYALSRCGRPTDYEQVIRLAEYAIQQGREMVALVSEVIYSLDPASLMSALEVLLGSPDPHQFAIGVRVLEHVANIEQPDFWTTYYDQMDQIVRGLNELLPSRPELERTLDVIEKHLSTAHLTP